MSVVILSLGSNVGEKSANINAMEESVAKLSKTAILSSPLYETEAVDVKDMQDNYYNKVVRIETDETPEYILEKTQEIETCLGRDNKWKKLPRTADIDILLFDNLIQSTHKLTIPHPRMFFRRFVIEGIKSIAPELVNPMTGECFGDYRICGEVSLQKIKIL